MDISSSERMIIDASDYHLTHDKIRKEIIQSQSDNYDDLRCQALNVIKGLQKSEIGTFMDEIKSKESQRWLENYACGLVRLYKKEKVIVQYRARTLSPSSHIKKQL